MVPAFVYTVQNVLINIAYRHLHPVTFAMLSQTKLLFTALFNFIFLRQKQSVRQVLALLTMLVAAVLLSIADHVQLSLSLGGSEKEGSRDGDGKVGTEEAGSSKASAGGGSGGLTESLAASVLFGAIPMLAASVTSGFGSMYCQWVSQLNFLHPPFPQVPILTNALAGILVGVVVQVSGGLKKLSHACGIPICVEEGDGWGGGFRPGEDKERGDSPSLLGMGRERWGVREREVRGAVGRCRESGGKMRGEWGEDEES
ncbi:unnamed protein product [Closterium sp. NIES-64]|nr:unnamed protein product [Closterium sp. NIES-64]